MCCSKVQMTKKQEYAQLNKICKVSFLWTEYTVFCGRLWLFNK